MTNMSSEGRERSALLNTRLSSTNVIDIELSRVGSITVIWHSTGFDKLRTNAGTAPLVTLQNRGERGQGARR